MPAAGMIDASREEVERIRAALRTAIRLSGVSSRQIERDLDLSTGYLTRILAGHVELRVVHVLSICQRIGLPPGNFFGALFPLRKDAGSRLAQGLSQLHPDQAQRPDPEALVHELRESIDRLESVVGKLKVRGSSR